MKTYWYHYNKYINILKNKICIYIITIHVKQDADFCQDADW